MVAMVQAVSHPAQEWREMSISTDVTSATFAGPCPRCAGGVPQDDKPGIRAGIPSKVDNLSRLCLHCSADEVMWVALYPTEELPPLGKQLFV